MSRSATRFTGGLVVVGIAAATVAWFSLTAPAMESKKDGKGERAKKAEKAQRGEREEREKEVELSEVPAKARAAIRKAARGGEVEEVELVFKTCFEAEWIQNGKEVEVLVTRGGKILGKEVEKADDEDEDEGEAEEEEEDEDEAEGEVEESESSLNKLPPKAKAAILKAARGHKIREVEQVVLKLYEADCEAKGREVEILVTPGGKVLSRAVEDDDEGEEAGEGDDEDEEAGEDEDDEDEAEDDDDDEHEHRKAGKHDDDDEDEAEDDDDDEHEHRKAGKHDDDDEDEAEDDDEEEENEQPVSLKQVPAKVRATILKAAKNHKVQEIEKIRVTLYEAEWRDGDKVIEIVVAPNGKILKKEVEEEDDDEGDDEEDEDEDDDDD